MSQLPPPQPTPLPRRVFYGTCIHSRSLTDLDYLSNALLGVDESGTIAFVEEDIAADQVEARLRELQWPITAVELVRLRKGEFLIPGFIDTHTHAPQYVNLSYGQQFELLDWLSNVTFPAEAEFSDPVYARRAYEGVVEKVINSGTTTCCWYGTLHQTTKILAAVCHRRGQRAFVGKCNMDRNSAEYYQEESARHSLADTEDFVSFVRSRCTSPLLASSPLSSAKRKPLSSSLVQPILTPRFAISCSDELLAGLGQMMDRDETLPCQTHLCENPSEIEYTKSLFPFASSYTQVYDHFRLLRPSTILAHCVHLTPPELSLIKHRNSGISHCPSSNFNLRSGTAKVAEMLDQGIKVGLGTDVSGGVSLGILSAIRAASFASKTIVFQARDSATPSTSAPAPAPSSSSLPTGEQEDPGEVLSPSPDAVPRPPNFFSHSGHLSVPTLFYLATLGGAQVCNLEDNVGNFQVGKEFDAVLVRTGQREVRGEEEGGRVGAGQGEVEAELKKALNGEWEEDKEGLFPSSSAASITPEGGKGSQAINPALIIEPDEGIEKVFEKFLFSKADETAGGHCLQGDDRNISSVFVRGRCIGGANPLTKV
ncbi:hypothetical protein JCM11641_008078 [Rhodosporidiobolus odoratus]